MSDNSPYPVESVRIYQALFDRPIPPMVAERFAAGSARLEAHASPGELACYRAAVSADLDLEALELAARYIHRLPLLTRKFRLMAYLAETVPENQSVFISHRDNLPGALLRVGFMTLRSAWLMAKGLALLCRVPVGGSR
jgi:hypothetical protein